MVIVNQLNEISNNKFNPLNSIPFDYESNIP